MTGRAKGIGLAGPRSALDALLDAPAKREHKYKAKRTQCTQGHWHDSKREAVRCHELRMLERAGEIVGLEQQPEFHFAIDGRAVLTATGRPLRLRGDFSYVEKGRKVVEDVKGVETKDFAVRWAFAKATWPDLDWRIVK